MAPCIKSALWLVLPPIAGTTCHATQTDHAGISALAICESRLLAINDNGLIRQGESFAFLMTLRRHMHLPLALAEVGRAIWP